VGSAGNDVTRCEKRMKSQEMTSLGAGREKWRHEICPAPAPLYLSSFLYILYATLLSRNSRLLLLSTVVLFFDVLFFTFLKFFVNYFLKIILYHFYIIYYIFILKSIYLMIFHD